MEDSRLYQIRGATEAVKALRADVEKYGFACLENALGDELIALLRAESAAQHASGSRATGREETSYQAHVADLDEVGRSFLKSPSMGCLLETVFDTPFALTTEASCYTYYASGDFLSAHRDRPVECAVTIIVYLDAASPDPRSPHTGLALRIFGEHGPEPSPRAIIPTRTGTMVVGRGSRTWHERPPLLPGEYVVALTACFTTANVDVASLARAPVAAGTSLGTAGGHEGGHFVLLHDMMP